MNIEFHTPHGEVKEWVINYVKDELIELYHRDNEIKRAEVYFNEQTDGLTRYQVCEIDLAIYGELLIVERKADSYDQAVRDALKELSEKVDEQIRIRNRLLDEITSTVKV